MESRTQLLRIYCSPRTNKGTALDSVLTLYSVHTLALTLSATAASLHEFRSNHSWLTKLVSLSYYLVVCLLKRGSTWALFLYK